jgi:hypothetical protein
LREFVIKLGLDPGDLTLQRRDPRPEVPQTAGRGADPTGQGCDATLAGADLLLQLATAFRDRRRRASTKTSDSHTRQQQRHGEADEAHGGPWLAQHHYPDLSEYRRRAP